MCGGGGVCVCVCVEGAVCVCVCVWGVCGVLALTMEHILQALNPLMSLGTDDRDMFSLFYWSCIGSGLGNWKELVF